MAFIVIWDCLSVGVMAEDGCRPQPTCKPDFAGEDAELRATLVVSSMLGFMIARALSMISAPRRRIFLGSHPRNAHVPPYGNASTIATVHPCEAHLLAAETPAMPAPITTKS